MAAKVTLHYKDFRPMRPGDEGYSKTARRYISPSTGETISVRQFQKNATRSNEQGVIVPKRASPSKKSYKPRTNDEQKMYAVLNEVRAGTSLAQALRNNNITRARLDRQIASHCSDLSRYGDNRYTAKLLKETGPCKVTYKTGKRKGQTYTRKKGYEAYPEALPHFHIILKGGEFRKSVPFDYKYASTVGYWGYAVKELYNKHPEILREFNTYHGGPLYTAYGERIELETNPDVIRRVLREVTPEENEDFMQHIYNKRIPL